MRVKPFRHGLVLIVAAISLAPTMGMAVPSEKPQIMCVMKNRTEVCYAKTMNVTSTGLTGASSEALIAALNLGARIEPTDIPPVDEFGVFRFMDDELFQAVSSLVTVTPPPATLPTEIPEDLHLLSDPGEKLPTIDLVNLPAMALALLQGENVVVDGPQATDFVNGALTASGLLPPSADATVSNTKIQITLNPDSLLPGLPGIGDEAEWLLDTKVSYETKLGDVPVRGPGAKVSVTLAPNGVVSHAHYALRGLADGPHRRIIHPSAGDDVCRTALGLGAEAPVTSELIYYAPPLTTTVAQLLPHFQCEPISTGAEGEILPLSQFVPAVADAPRAAVAAAAEGAMVYATARVEGGTGPYTLQWTSSTNGPVGTDLSVSYEVDLGAGKDITETAFDETLTLTVVDANGLVTTGSSTVQIDLSLDPEEPVDTPTLVSLPLDEAHGGSHSYSGDQVASWSGTDSPACAPYTGGFRDWTNSSPSPRPDVRWTWNTNSSWESDFKSDTITGGNDHTYVDDVDMAFYCGHGSPNTFTFENTYGPTDQSLHYSEARWGDRDLEWFALLSCQVMAETSGGLSTAQRWGSAFDGLHEMMGFHTNAAASGNLGSSLAFYAQGFSTSGYTMAPRKMHDAFVQAAIDSQPSDRVWATLLPVSYSYQWNRNDYFHGRGNISADIPANQIYYFFRHTGNT